MLLAIEGIDGAGKGTLCRGLLALAARAGLRAASLSFPRYEKTQFADLIGRYLRGELGAMDQVSPRFTALLYGGDRFESRDELLALIGAHDLVILDRYVASNIAYNAAKVPPGERQSLIAWIEQLEFGQFALPRPDLTILLATKAQLADRLVGEKAVRGYTTARRDLHEADRGFMHNVAEIYDGLAAAGGPAWRRIDPLNDHGDLMPPSDIAAAVWRQCDLESLVK